MALVATFTADFDKFNASLKSASVSLTTFDNATKKSTQGLKRELESISGQKLAAEAARMTEAVKRLGGAGEHAAGLLKLLPSELERVRTAIDSTVKKAALMGEKVPDDIRKMHDELAKLPKAANDVSNAIGGIKPPTQATGAFGSVLGHINKESASATTSIKNMALGFVGAQAAISAVTGAGKLLIGFLSDSVSEYLDAEKAAKQLTGALKAQGTAAPQLTKQYADLAEEIQRTTVFSDDLVTEMQALLVQIGDVMPSEMEGAIRAAADLAAGLGIDLEQATKKVALALQGNVAGLKKYGITIDEAKFAAEGATVVFDAVQRRFGGQAAAEVETYAGRLQQATNAWKNFQEEVGRQLITGPLAIALFRNLGQAVEGSKVSMDDADVSWGKLIEKIPLVGLQFSGTGGIIFLIEQYTAALNANADASQRLAAQPDPFKSRIAPNVLPDISGRGMEIFNEQVKENEERLKAQKKAAEEAKQALEQFNKAVRDISGVTALKDAEIALKQIAAAGGPLKILDSNLEALAKTFERAAEAARLAGKTDLARQYAELARTLSPITQFQQRWNVTIGDFVTLNPSYTDAIEEQTSLFKKQADQIAFGVLPNLLTLEELFKRIGTVGFKAPVIEDRPTKGPSLAKKMGDELAEVFKGIPMTLARAFEGGGDWEGAFKSIGSQIGAIIGKQVGESLGKVLGKAIGGTIGAAFGPIGAAVGEAIGSLVGPLIGKLHDAFTVSASEDVMRRVGQSWGVSISEGLADEIAETAKTLGGANLFEQMRGAGADRQAAEILHFADILREAGGEINATNFDQFIARFRDVFVMFQEGRLSLEQTQQVLDESFGAFAKHIVDSGNVATREFVELIRLNAQLGTQSKAIADFVKEQATRAGSALATAFEGASTAEEFERLGVLALGAFNAAIESGLSMQQALAAVGPSLDKLVKGFADLGIEADAALQPLLVAHQVAETTAGAAAGALNEAILALSNFGALNEQTLDALEGQLGTIFSRVQAEVAKVGGTHADALRQIVPFLQQALRASEEFGLALDPATRELIQQAEELGILGEAAESETDIMKDGFEDVVNAVQDLERALRGLPPIIRDIGNAANDIEFPKGPIFQPPGAPPGAPPTPPFDPTRPQSTLGGRVSALVNTGGAQALTLMPVFVHGQASASEIERAMTSQLPVALATGQPRAAVTILARLAAEEAIARGR